MTEILTQEQNISEIPNCEHKKTKFLDWNYWTGLPYLKCKECSMIIEAT